MQKKWTEKQKTRTEKKTHTHTKQKMRGEGKIEAIQKEMQKVKSPLQSVQQQ